MTRENPYLPHVRLDQYFDRGSFRKAQGGTHAKLLVAKPSNVFARSSKIVHGWKVS